MPIGSVCQALIALRGIPYRQCYYKTTLFELQENLAKTSKALDYSYPMLYNGIRKRRD